MWSSIQRHLLQGWLSACLASKAAREPSGVRHTRLRLSTLPVLFYGAAAWAQTATSKPGMLEQLMPLAFIFLIFYFLLIRPQQKRHKKHQEFLNQMKVGDKVLTSGGVFGTVGGITDQFVVLEVSEGVKIRILRSSISSAVREASS